MTEALLIGQAILMLITFGGVFIAFGKILGQVSEGNKLLSKLTELVEALTARVNNHETQLALLHQRNEFLDAMPVHLHRRQDDPKV